MEVVGTKLPSQFNAWFEMYVDCRKNLPSNFDQWYQMYRGGRNKAGLLYYSTTSNCTSTVRRIYLSRSSTFALLLPTNNMLSGQDIQSRYACCFGGSYVIMEYTSQGLFQKSHLGTVSNCPIVTLLLIHK